MNIILCSGIPASGKSFFSRELSKRLDIPYISKDEIQIDLFYRYGFKSHDEKLKLVHKADEIMYRTIQDYVLTDRDLIVDKFFKEYETLRSCIQVCDVNVISFYLYAEASILSDRYNKRIESGERAKPMYIENVFPEIEGVTKYHPKMTVQRIEELELCTKEKTYENSGLRIDTSDLNRDYLSDALRFVKNQMGMGIRH